MGAHEAACGLGRKDFKRQKSLKMVNPEQWIKKKLHSLGWGFWFFKWKELSYLTFWKTSVPFFPLSDLPLPLPPPHLLRKRKRKKTLQKRLNDLLGCLCFLMTTENNAILLQVMGKSSHSFPSQSASLLSNCCGIPPPPSHPIQGGGKKCFYNMLY